ncbi:MAG: hypothetical protein PHO20_03200 [Candidatus Peribacteraceae bacterium]|nr:hypothetical protein [Candidatus Peribacteraceae bacterium]MDD5739748.1 hypothetical protein [Candidatus Peribacteraceae bacterium]
MRCLFLDLASHSGLLACVTEERVIASEDSNHRIGDHELIPLFEKTLQAAGWKADGLTHCACVIGPGGFMSLRVAVAFANTLIHQLKVPGAGIHLSDLYAARTPHPSLGCARDTLSRGERDGERSEKNKELLWLHSTKKHELFVRGFGSYASLWPKAAHVTVKEFLLHAAEIRESPLRWCGELIPEHEALFKEKELQPVVLCPLADVLPAFLGKQTFTEKLLEPWYGRSW